MPCSVLGVRIDSYTRPEARQQVALYLQEPKAHLIVTPNPEILVRGVGDSYFREVLNGSDLSLCDGKGVELATRGQTPRISGSDFIHDICAEAVLAHQPIALIGDHTERATIAAQYLQTEHPGLHVCLAVAGPHFVWQKVGSTRIPVAQDEGSEDELIDQIIRTAPSVLIVGFRHEVQEKWLAAHIKDFPSVRVMMGVGGSIDFLSGKIARAPVFFRRIGIEWLWRLIQEPKRIGRIFTATVLFPYFVIKNHLFHRL